MAALQPITATALVNGASLKGRERAILSPVDGTGRVGTVHEPDPSTADEAIKAAKAGFAAWSAEPAQRVPRSSPGGRPVGTAS